MKNARPGLLVIMAFAAAMFCAAGVAGAATPLFTIKPASPGSSTHSTDIIVCGGPNQCYRNSAANVISGDFTVTSNSSRVYPEAYFKIPPGFVVSSGCSRISGGVCYFSLPARGSVNFSMDRIEDLPQTTSSDDVVVDTVTNTVIDQTLQNVPVGSDSSSYSIP